MKHFSDALIENLIESADLDASKQFFNSVYSNSAELDQAAFHKAYDAQVNAAGLTDIFDSSTGLLVNRGTYGKIKVCSDEDLQKALKAFWRKQFADTINNQPKDLIDHVAAQKFYNALNDSKYPYIDLEAFHQAFDQAEQADPISACAIWNRGYKPGLNHLDTISRYTRETISKYTKNPELKKALLMLYDAQKPETIPYEDGHQMMLDMDKQYKDSINANLPKAIEQIKNNPDTADDYNQYIALTNDAPIDVIYKVWYRRGYVYSDTWLVLNGQELPLYYAPEKLAKDIYYAVHQYVTLANEQSFKDSINGKNKDIADLLNKYGKVYFMLDNNLYTIYNTQSQIYNSKKQTTQYKVYDEMTDTKLSEDEAKNLDLVNAEIIAVSNSSSSTRYHGTFHESGGTIYYNPNIDTNILNKCGITFKNIQDRNNGGTSITPIPEDKVPNDLKQYGITRGENTYTVMDSSD